MFQVSNKDTRPTLIIEIPQTNKAPVSIVDFHKTDILHYHRENWLSYGDTSCYKSD